MLNICAMHFPTEHFLINLFFINAVVQMLNLCQLLLMVFSRICLSTSLACKALCLSDQSSSKQARDMKGAHRGIERGSQKRELFENENFINRATNGSKVHALSRFNQTLINAGDGKSVGSIASPIYEQISEKEARL